MKFSDVCLSDIIDYAQDHMDETGACGLELSVPAADWPRLIREVAAAQGITAHPALYDQPAVLIKDSNSDRWVKLFVTAQ